MTAPIMPGFTPADIVTSAGQVIHGALWGGKGVVGATNDRLVAWHEKALDVRGQPIKCGHALQQEAPDATLAALLPFLTETTR